MGKCSQPITINCTRVGDEYEWCVVPGCWAYSMFQKTVISVSLLLRFLMGSLSVCVWVFLLTVVCYAQFVVLDKVETATERIREVAGIVWTFNSWGGTISNPPFHLDVCISSGVLYSEANENFYLCFLWLWRFFFLKNDVSGGRRCSHERLEIKQ